MRFPRRLHARKALVILAVLLLAGWLIPPFFHAGRYRKILQAALENKLGRPVELGTITLRLLPHPGFSIQNVVVEEDLHFGSEPFARVDNVECDLRWSSLLGSRMDCSKITLDHPVFNIVRGSQGRWNFENILHRGRAAPQAGGAGNRRPSAAPFDFEVENARVNFTLNGAKKPFALDDVRARFQLDPAQGALAFNLQGTPVRTDIALLQPPGPVVIAGEWRPSMGPQGELRARLTTRNSLLYAWIPMVFHRDPGIYGLVSADILLEGSPAAVKVSGQMELAQLHRWEASPVSSPAPVDFRFAGIWDRARDLVQVDRADASFAGSSLHLNGVIRHVSQGPDFNLALALAPSRLQDLMAVGDNLVKYPSPLAVSGRVSGLVTFQGPWGKLSENGSLKVQSLVLSERQVAITSRQAEIRVGGGGAYLLPTQFILSPGIEGVGQGSLFPGFPGSEPAGTRSGRHMLRSPRLSVPGYKITLNITNAPLRSVITVAQRWGVSGLRNLEATGTGDASLQISGGAWPFTRPKFEAQGHLNSARLLLAGLTEPVQLTQFRFEIENGAFAAVPFTAGIGNTTFSGWVKHDPARGSAWRFDAKAPRLSLEQASLWFAAIGARQPAPILDLIPGLRSLEARRRARQDLFATLDAQGTLECPNVTFHALRLRDFRAGVTLSGRVARISEAAFRVAAGNGSGFATVNFRQVPADIGGEFRLTGLRLQKLTPELPAALSGARGLLFATGRFTTRGLTRQEMAAHLAGGAAIEVKDAILGKFDPLAATARAASLGVLAPLRGVEAIPALSLNLIVKNRSVHLAPALVHLRGGVLAVDGRYNFDGRAVLLVRADLTHVNRRWLSDAPPGPSHRREATIELTGHLSSLAVKPAAQTASVQP